MQTFSVHSTSPACGACPAEALRAKAGRPRRGQGRLKSWRPCMQLGVVAFGVTILLAAAFPLIQGSKPAGGAALGDMSWKEAETALTSSSVVVIPLGVATVQHGPHLKLNNNERLARYLAARVQAGASV